jgi:hypothetical protein
LLQKTEKCLCSSVKSKEHVKLYALYNQDNVKYVKERCERNIKFLILIILITRSMDEILYFFKLLFLLHIFPYKQQLLLKWEKVRFIFPSHAKIFKNSSCVLIS